MRLELSDGVYVDAVAIVPDVERLIDATANDSDKSFTTPGGEVRKLNSIFVKLVTDATVGNRIITAEVQDPSGVVVGRISAGAVQAAGTTRYYLFMQGAYRETAFINSDIQVPIPQDSYLPAGYILRVYDSAAISAAGDDMTVSVSISKMKGA
jgi:hypothetical protein